MTRPCTSCADGGLLARRRATSTPADASERASSSSLAGPTDSPSLSASAHALSRSAVAWLSSVARDAVVDSMATGCSAALATDALTTEGHRIVGARRTRS